MSTMSNREWLASIGGDSMISPVPDESQLAQPAYLPGDLVLTKDDCVGVVTNATVIINGCRIEWNYNPTPGEVRSGSVPEYELKPVPGDWNTLQKERWWRASEFAAVVKSPIHRLAWRSVGGRWVSPAVAEIIKDRKP